MPFQEVERPNVGLSKAETPSPNTYTLNILERIDLNTTVHGVDILSWCRRSTMTVDRRFTNLLAIKQWVINKGKATFAAHINNDRVLSGDGVTFEIDFDHNVLTSDDELVPAMSTVIISYPVENN